MQSLSQLRSQSQVQKLNAFRYCKSLLKSGETAVTCRYFQYFNLPLSGIRWCSGLRGILQTEKKSQTCTFLNYIHSRWHILLLMYLLLFKFKFSCMQIWCQLSVLSLINHSQISHPLRITLYTFTLDLYCNITILSKIGAKFLLTILNSDIISPLGSCFNFTFITKKTYEGATSKFLLNFNKNCIWGQIPMSNLSAIPYPVGRLLYAV